MPRKEPWFKFWATDYLTDSDVDELSLESQGLLVRMWCVCSQRGNIPDDPEEIARLTRCKLQSVLQCHSQCKRLFKLRNGLLYSERMEREKAKSEVARANAEMRHRRQPSAAECENSDAIRNANGTAKRTAQKARKQESQRGESEETDFRTEPSKTDSLSERVIDPHMMARGLCDQLNISHQMGPGSVYLAVYDRAQIESKRGGDLEALCNRMVEAHQAWMRESVSYRWGLAKFFGDGWWEKPETWPLKRDDSTSEKVSLRERKCKEFMESEDDDAK